MATCVGLFLFTRILIPDVMLTFSDRAGDVGVPARARRGRAASAVVGLLLAASLGIGLLLKSLVAVVFPLARRLIYLFLTQQLFSREDVEAAASASAAR